jgi:hypothetical protein
VALEALYNELKKTLFALVFLSFAVAISIYTISPKFIMPTSWAGFVARHNIPFMFISRKFCRVANSIFDYSLKEFTEPSSSTKET